MSKTKTRPYEVVLELDRQDCTDCVFSNGHKCTKHQTSYKDISCVVMTNEGERMGKFDYSWRTS